MLSLGACGGSNPDPQADGKSATQRAGDQRLADGIKRAKKEAEKHSPGGAKEFEDAERKATKSFAKLIATTGPEGVRAMLKSSGSLPPDLRRALERRRKELGIPKR